MSFRSSYGDAGQGGAEAKVTAGQSQLQPAGSPQAAKSGAAGFHPVQRGIDAVCSIPSIASFTRRSAPPGGPKLEPAIVQSPCLAPEVQQPGVLNLNLSQQSAVVQGQPTTLPAQPADTMQQGIAHAELPPQCSPGSEHP